MPDRIRVLYVDDEPDIRTIVDMSLSLDPDMEVRLAASGGEAFAAIDTGWRPDIALIDMMMPDMNGLELLAALHARPETATLPILFVTASARTVDLAGYVAAGAIGAISKPFDPVGLAPLVRSYHDANQG